MGNVPSVLESEGKRKALDADLSSDAKKRALVATPDEEEQTPSIFSCRRSTAAIPVDSQGPYVSAQNVEKESFFELHETKHKIFLIHAEAERNFVEQLCVDLETKGYSFPFFDQRSHILPEGKDFAPLVSEAAKQCSVVVIVLSETFMISKWPMIELGKFYEAKKGGNSSLTMLPLFFKLVTEDLYEWSINERWMPKWREYASSDETIDVNLWIEAVKALPKVNGFIFEQPKALHKAITGILYRSEVDYRSAVTQAIFELSPPSLLRGASENVVGYDRLCKMLSSQFVEDTTTGVLLLGLHGMPGLGKTTMSQALCDYFHNELAGRVCHVELGDSSTTPLMRQKKVLKKLWGLKNYLLDGIWDVDQGWTLMRDCLNQDSTKRPSPMFLAIDNVSGDQHSLDETRAYLDAGFCPKSRIMVTSRSQNIIKGLLLDSKFCKLVPDLTEEEAGTLFLNIAAPGRILSALSYEERRNLSLCIKQCRFSRDGLFDSDQQCHPLALRALANYFRNQGVNKKSLSVWQKYLENFNRGSSHDLFDILEMQFKSLDQIKQIFFLDIALFGDKLLLDAKLKPTYEDWVTWLGGLHMDAPRAHVEGVLQQLEKSGMIKWLEVTMHQLYKEFAEWFVTKENLSKKEWYVRESAPPYERTRLRIVLLKGGIPRSRVRREWRSLVLLQLYFCKHVRGLDLVGLDCLRHLELAELKNLETLALSPKNDSLRFVWLSGLDSLKHLPDFGSSCDFVQVISITRCLNLREPLRVKRCSELNTLVTDLRLCPQLDMSLAASLSSLQNLFISNLRSGQCDELNLQGLGLCSQLQILKLENLPVKKVLGLAEVTGRVGRRVALFFVECPNLDEAPEGLTEATRVFLWHSGELSYWSDDIVDNTTDAARKHKELHDEAAKRGMYMAQPPESPLHLQWAQHLGPGLSGGAYLLHCDRKGYGRRQTNFG